MKKRVVALLTVAAMLVSMIAVETVAFADEAEKYVPYVAVSLPPAENAWQANFAEMIDKKMAEAQEEGGSLRLEGGEARPESHGKTGEVRGAEGRRLDACRTLHRNADYVALELHEEVVRACSAIDT